MGSFSVTVLKVWANHERLTADKPPHIQAIFANLTPSPFYIDDTFGAASWSSGRLDRLSPRESRGAGDRPARTAPRLHAVRRLGAALRLPRRARAGRSFPAQ